MPARNPSVVRPEHGSMRRKRSLNHKLFYPAIAPALSLGGAAYRTIGMISPSGAPVGTRSPCSIGDAALKRAMSLDRQPALEPQVLVCRLGGKSQFRRDKRYADEDAGESGVERRIHVLTSLRDVR
jgi:hypothetical protein